MPRLPEIEAMCAGLARHVAERTVIRAEVLDSRPLCHRDRGAQAPADQLTGRTLTTAIRRGKFLQLPLDDRRALPAHLGMSGQLLTRGTTTTIASGAAPGSRRTVVSLVDPDTLPGRYPADLGATKQPHYVRGISTSAHHLRVRFHLSVGLGGNNGADGDDSASTAVLDLVDQHMPGSLHVVDLIPIIGDAPDGMGDPWPLLPASVTHITCNLLDPALELTGPTGVIARVRTSRHAIEAQPFDQGLVSDTGNIYADEGLWEAEVRGLHLRAGLGLRVVAWILGSAAEATRRAFKIDDVSFDALYVGAEGVIGFFACKLGAYGR